MRKKLISLILATTLLVTSFSGVVHATSTSQQAQQEKEKAEQELSQLQGQMQDLQNEQEQLRSQMDGVEQELVELMVSVDVLKEDIKDKKEELKKVRKNLKKAKADEKEQYEAMKLRIKYMYEQGDTAFIEAILGAQNMADLLNQVEYYEKVYSYDRQLLITYQETKLEIIALEKEVKTELAELEDMKVTLDGEQKSLEAVMAKLKKQITNFDQKLASAKQKAEGYKKTIIAQNNIIKEEKRKREEQEKKRREEEERRREEERREQERRDQDDEEDAGEDEGGSGSESSKDPGYSTSVSPSALIEYAKTFVGRPYVWGGTDPHTGADCSGFTQYVYAHFGISIPRTSYLQRFCGKEVSFNKAQPGDIICYSGHVALYLGNNCIVHAKGREYGIVISNDARYHDIITIRRVL